MTCIVGLEHHGVVHMGADSAGVGGYDLTVRADEKLFTNGDFTIGFTSSFRMGQLLQYEFRQPERPRGMSDMGYLVASVIPAMRRTFEEGGYMRKDNGREAGGTMLLAYRGRLYAIHDDFQVERSVDGLLAVGCGASYALGGLYASRGAKPEKRLRTALEAAAKFSAGVCRPFKVVST